MDHPQIKNNKIGILLLNLGTPEATDYWSMRRYLSEFLSDRRVIDYPSYLWQPLLQGIILSIRPFKSGKAYEKIWNHDKNESPLKTITRSQCSELKSSLNNDKIEVEWAMRYGHPSTQSGIESLTQKGCKKILLFALYPQYSAATTASAYDKAFDFLKTMPWQPEIRTISTWHDDPSYINCLKQSVEKQLSIQNKKPDVMLASFHGLPKRYLTQGDPYHCFCAKTSRLLQEALNWDEKKWHLTFQSRFGPEEWLQPYTEQTVIDLAKKGVKHLGIISPAFVSDCIETLEEINIGLQEVFLENGGEKFTYIPCLNDRDHFIDFLKTKALNELKGWIN